MDLLDKLILRGDTVEIRDGRLLIQARSGLPIPEGWMRANQVQLLRQIATRAGANLFCFQQYSTGHYGPGRYPGITLTFQHINSGELMAVSYNAELNRKRNTAKGRKNSRLPGKQFRVTERHQFVRLWDSLGLSRPRRLSAFHDCMGKLKDVVVSAEMKPNGGMDKRKIQLANVPPTRLHVQNTAPPGTARTKDLQLPDNSPTTLPDKECPEREAVRGLQGSSGACGSEHELSNQDNTYLREGVSSTTGNPPETMLQSNADWLADFDNHIPRYLRGH